MLAVCLLFEMSGRLGNACCPIKWYYFVRRVETRFDLSQPERLIHGGHEAEFTKGLSRKDAVPAEPRLASSGGNFTVRNCCLWGHLQRLPRLRLPNVFVVY